MLSQLTARIRKIFSSPPVETEHHKPESQTHGKKSEAWDAQPKKQAAEVDLPKREEKRRDDEEDRPKRKRTRKPKSDDRRGGDGGRAGDWYPETPEMGDWQPPASADVEVIDGSTRYIDLDLPLPLMRGVCELGFTHCTPIQAGALPESLKGRDIAGRAQTGTGKTAAFLICAMNHMMRNPLENQRAGTPRAVILAPTRELAIQIQKDAAALGKYTGLRCMVVFGGMDHDKQRRQLESGPVDILAGTPGRIIDYARSGALNLRQAEILVIDEADRMLDMGFIPDVRRIVNQFPPPEKRQTLLYSATLERSILRLVESWQRDPAIVEIEPESVATDNIEQRFYSVSVDHKMSVLVHQLKENDGRTLIFTNRKDTASRVYRNLMCQGVTCELLSGDVPQNKRMRILEDLRSGKIPVIIATDVAARGIHVDDITLVVNYDLPFETDSYVHRIGRTGRAGASGLAVTFVDEFGGYEIMELEEYLGGAIDTQRPDDSWLVMPPPPPGAPKMKDLKDDRPMGDRRPGRRPGGGRGRSGGGGGRGRSGGGGGGRRR